MTINIEGIKCSALVDTGVLLSYVSSTIISPINQKINKRTIRTESKRTERLVSSSMRNIPVYSVEIKDINNEFSFKISTLEKSVLLELSNPNYHEIRNNYQHLDITDIYYTKIKTPERERE